MSEEQAIARIDHQNNDESRISAEEVSQYLLNNPAFFRHREDLLLEMELPHRAGSAVSLVERQVSLLRERNIEHRHRFSALLDTARVNDQLFEHTRKLVLAVLESTSLETLCKAVETTIRREFNAEHCRLLLLESDGVCWDSGGSRLDSAQALETMPGILGQSRPVVGALRPQENALLFGETTIGIKSAAAVAVRNGKTLALLVLGSHHHDRFKVDMGTLFLEFIGEVLQRTLPQYAKTV